MNITIHSHAILYVKLEQVRIHNSCNETVDINAVFIREA